MIFAASTSRFSGWCGFNDRALEIAAARLSESADAIVISHCRDPGAAHSRKWVAGRHQRAAEK
jgi:hypothetical protein